MCGNLLSCFAPLDDRGDRTNQLHWLELLHTSYISLLNQAGKGRVFYSYDKCFETGADLGNIIDKLVIVLTKSAPASILFFKGINSYKIP